jgi:hypothetical protein
MDGAVAKVVKSLLKNLTVDDTYPLTLQTKVLLLTLSRF